jgi:diadenosine tetraphosphate (Ap4A) HIT family hydrolase
MFHYRKKHIAYGTYNKKDEKNNVNCSLCETIQPDSIVEETSTMRIIKNRVPYDVFDNLPSTGEHYMIVPKRHVVLIADFTDEEKLDQMSIIARYEKEGFNIYARSNTNIRRSQRHQHTHLIKLQRRLPRFIIAIDKPYFLWFR